MVVGHVAQQATDININGHAVGCSLLTFIAGLPHPESPVWYPPIPSPSLRVSTNLCRIPRTVVVVNCISRTPKANLAQPHSLRWQLLGIGPGSRSGGGTELAIATKNLKLRDDNKHNLISSINY
jgi:hypothetical protein